MRDLPSGAVACLFADVEASTALGERDRAAISSHGGALFDPVGNAESDCSARHRRTAKTP